MNEDNLSRNFASDIEHYLMREYGMSSRSAEAFMVVHRARPAPRKEVSIKTPEFVEFAQAWTKWMKWNGL